MKVLTIGLVLIGIFIVFQSFIAINAVKTEKQKYRTVLKDDALEIRYYPSATMATIYSSATNYKSVASSGFGKLARFIFGGNNENESIAMTAPVALQKDGGSYRVSFMMPHKYTLETLPKPNNKSIKILSLPKEKYAVIVFSGLVRESSYQEKEKLLNEFIKGKKLNPSGEINIARYNPPWTLPFFRRNELMLKVN